MKKKYMTYGWCLWLVFFAVLQTVAAQESARDSLYSRMERLADTDNAWRSEIDFSAGKMSLGEVFRHIARVNGVNLCVKVDEGQTVTCNFDRVRVADLILFLCREYHLEVEVTGNILSVQSPLPVVAPPVVPSVAVDSSGKVLSYDLLNNNLVDVVREFARLTAQNIIVPQQLYDRQVSGYTAGLPVEEAIETLAASNDLDIRKEKSGTWTILPPVPDSPPEEEAPFRFHRRNPSADLVSIDSNGRVTVLLEQGNVQDIVSGVCDRLKINHSFLLPLDRQVSLFIRHVDFHTLLDVLFAGTSYSYQCEDGVYIFGATGKENEFQMTRVIALQYRAADQVIGLIPAHMKAGVQVQLFAEQNSIIASGSSRQVQRVTSFLKTIDRSVPLVTIEVMIVNSRRSVSQEVGISAGLGEGPKKTSGTLSPGINMSLSSGAINKLINSLNGFGSINLGKVTPDFYLSLKALEEAGSIEMRSTPKLSTLNGHEAVLKSGEKKYYKEVQNNYYGSQNPIPTESYIWKDIEANLSLKIVPFVSLEGKITLSVEIEQSEFTAREEKDAPPGTLTRSFKSQVKVRDGEMVLLGGIETNSREKTSGGLPFLARVPVLKWIFGSSRNNKLDEKLNVFIKPSVIY